MKRESHLQNPKGFIPLGRALAVWTIQDIRQFDNVRLVDGVVTTVIREQGCFLHL